MAVGERARGTGGKGWSWLSSGRAGRGVRGFRGGRDRATKVPGEVPSSTVVVQRRCFDRGNAVGFDPRSTTEEWEESVVDGYTCRRRGKETWAEEAA